MKLKYFILAVLTVNFLSAQVENTKTSDQPISLDSWRTITPDEQKYWSIKDSTLIGGDGIQNIPINTYLYTKDSYGDFEFRCLFRISGDHSTGLINSGIQYRSTIQNGNIIGYQADIGNGYWGDIYDEHRRGKLVGGNLNTLKHILNEDGWNSYIIRCIGNKHELYINGVKTAEYFEMDPKVPNKGVIGIQLHSGGNAKVEFKHITIQQL